MAATRDDQQQFLEWIGSLRQLHNNREEVQFYEKEATAYEVNMHDHHYSGPKYFLELINSLEHNHNFKIDRNGKVIDVAAGTGLAGTILRDQLGFKGDIDALEPSESMWKLAEPKNLYNKWYKDLIEADKETTVPSNTYDLVTCVGAFNTRSLTPDCLPEVIRMAKPKGYIAAVLNYSYWQESYKAAIYHLIDKKVIRMMEEKFHEFYTPGGYSCIAFVIQKL